MRSPYLLGGLPERAFSSPPRMTIPKEAVPLLERLHAFLSSRAPQSYVVGGFLRDTLLARQPNRDIDVAIAGDALGLARELADHLGGAYVLMHEERQVARVVLQWENQRWFIDISALQGGLEQDLARRDFTVNALAIPLDAALAGRTEAVVDPCGGLADLQRKTIRAMNDGIFRDDPVRLLRAVRFSAQLGFGLEPGTKEMVRRDAPLMPRAVPERAREELYNMLALPTAEGALWVLDRLQLLTRLIPELEAARGVDQPFEHYWDVFEHSVHTVRMAGLVLRSGPRSAPALLGIPWTAELSSHFRQEVAGGHTRAVLLKLSALLHDVAKPLTKTVEPNGRARFIGHSEKGAEMAADIMRRLRFSNKEVGLVERIVLHHLRPGLMSGDQPLPTRRAVYRYFRDLEDAAYDVLFLSLADYLAARGPLLDPFAWRDYAGKIRHVLSCGLGPEPAARPPRLVTGDDLMQAISLPPGPVIGRLLEKVNEAHAAGEVRTKEDAIDLARRTWQSEVAVERVRGHGE
ncbi:MAG: CCA tRNA nucleotidyltransferase [Chloroflexi bacterium]|nr:CCA tRNA nucleotidyltransferase [Chloroflexota bacterium]